MHTSLHAIINYIFTCSTWLYIKTNVYHDYRIGFEQYLHILRKAGLKKNGFGNFFKVIELHNINYF